MFVPIIDELPQAAEPAMNEHADGTLTAARDLCHFNDRKVVDHPQHDGLGGRWRELTHYGERPFKRIACLESRIGAKLHNLLMAGVDAVGIVSLCPTVRINVSPTGDGEYPPPEVVPVADESFEGPADINPHLACCILGRQSVLGAQQAQDLWVIDAPQPCNRIPLTGACPFERFDVSDVMENVCGADEPTSATIRSTLRAFVQRLLSRSGRFDMTMLRYTSVLVAATLLAACGGSDAGDSIQSAESTATSAGSDPAVSTPVDDGPVDADADADADVDADADASITTSTDDDSPEAPTTASAPPDTSATAPTVESDDRTLALLASGLYSVPGEGTHCESTTQKGVGLQYAFPAEGGDLYSLCLVEARAADDALRDARLKVVDPSGKTLVDVRVNEVVTGDGFDNLEDLVGNGGIDSRVKALLELTYADGRRVLHGARLGSGAQSAQFSVPIYLPHDRPAGVWSISFGGDSVASVRIDAPCADGNGRKVGDPLDVRSGLRFIRSGPLEGEPPVPFEHCRLFPNVVGMSIAGAQAVIGAWAENLGASVKYQIDNGDSKCGPDSRVKRSAPAAGHFSAREISDPERLVLLTPERPCGSQATDDSSPDSRAVDEAESTDPTTTTQPADQEGDASLTTEPPVGTSIAGELITTSLPSEEDAEDQ